MGRMILRLTRYVTCLRAGFLTLINALDVLLLCRWIVHLSYPPTHIQELVELVVGAMRLLRMADSDLACTGTLYHGAFKASVSDGR